MFFFFLVSISMRAYVSNSHLAFMETHFFRRSFFPMARTIHNDIISSFEFVSEKKEKMKNSFFGRRNWNQTYSPSSKIKCLETDKRNQMKKSSRFIVSEKAINLLSGNFYFSLLFLTCQVMRRMGNSSIKLRKRIIVYRMMSFWYEITIWNEFNDIFASGSRMIVRCVERKE